MINIINESKKVSIVIVDSGINIIEDDLNSALIGEVDYESGNVLLVKV